MPGNGDFPEYATSVSGHARKIRDSLDGAVQLTLNKVIDELADDPDAHPHRITPFDKAANLYLYTHPQPRIELTYRIDRENKKLYFIHFAVPQFAESKLVFISYSHEDKAWLDELNKWLSGYEEDERVRIWSDERIKAGDDWREEIADALSSARVAVLLVSQDFLASKFIKENELPQLLDARERGELEVLWVAISSSAYEETAIERYQAANDPDVPLDTLDPPAQKVALKSIYKQIKEALEQ